MISTIETHKRYYEIPSYIHFIGTEIPLVHKYIQRFIYGDIITLDEFYCKLIVDLSRDWKVEYNNMIEQIKVSHINASFSS